MERHRRREGDREASVKTNGYRLQAVAKVLPGLDPCKLTREHALDYLEARRATPGARAGTQVSPATLRAELSAVLEFQRHAVRRGWAAKATWEDAPRPSGKRGRESLRLAEVGPWLLAAEALGEEARAKRLDLEARDRARGRTPLERYDLRTWERWPALAWVMLSTALRPGEVLRLRARDVDLEARALYVADQVDAGERFRTKTAGAARWVDVHSARALELLEELLADLAPTDLLYPGRTGPASPCCDCTSLEAKCQATAERAGVPYVPPYGLRHTAAQIASGAGATLASTQGLLGHGTATTTTNYLEGLRPSGSQASELLGARLDRARAAAGGADGEGQGDKPKGPPTLRVVK